MRTGSDWTRPGTGKTLEDNAALLHVYVEAAQRLRHAEWLEQAAAIVRWVEGRDGRRGARRILQRRSRLAGSIRTMYVDKNAMMVGAFIRAAALFDDIWLRDYALKSLEAVIVPAYTPGGGVAHVIGDWRSSRRPQPSHRSDSRRLGVDLGARRHGAAPVLDACGRGGSVRCSQHVG